MSFTLCLTFTFMTFTFRAMTLDEHMSLHKLTDAALASKVGCDRSMISKIRNRVATPSLKLAMAINRETGVDVSKLLPEAAE
ncbi:helix-turn-helix transcriptional regulator [Rhizobium sp. CG5]|nr:helix-turn-helix transcriptional regulator [Rhizobium sp. CG5]